MLNISRSKLHFKIDICLVEFVRHYCDKNLNLKRVLILNKRTRYEIEKRQHPGISELQLEKLIRKRGSDYDRILWHHHRHKEFHKQLVDTFSKYDLEVEAVIRNQYTDKEMNWADLVVVGGGDGTFLLGATQIPDPSKPIVGFNTDPDRSEGYLCLPKKYSYNIPLAVEKIMRNDFRWLLRDRIEVEMEGLRVDEDATVVDQTVDVLCSSRNAEVELSKEYSKKVLPILALNEVFIGENISSRVSSLVLKTKERPQTLVKCSGLCISTGTGSTSWLMSINRLTRERVEKLMEVASKSVNDEEIDRLVDEYNKSLRFPSDSGKMFWSLREPIYAGVVPDPPGLPAAEFSPSVWVKSRCSWGCLVIDGSRVYSFNDGTKARLYLNPSKRLRTIVLD